MTNMTDQSRVNAIMTAIYSSSTTFTVTPGTGGGAAFNITPPYSLRLMTAQGSNTANGTELTTSGGYVAGGQSLGATFCSAFSGGISSNAGVVTWSVTGTWSAVTAIEIWDSAATKLRWLQGALTATLSGVVNGDTVQFAAGSITVNASAV